MSVEVMGHNNEGELVEPVHIYTYRDEQFNPYRALIHAIIPERKGYNIVFPKDP